jgi:hypothetical protein
MTRAFAQGLVDALTDFPRGTAPSLGVTSRAPEEGIVFYYRRSANAIFIPPDGLEALRSPDAVAAWQRAANAAAPTTMLVGIRETPARFIYAIGYHEAAHASAPTAATYSAWAQSYTTASSRGLVQWHLSDHADTNPAEGWAELATRVRLHGTDGLPPLLRTAYDAQRAAAKHRPAYDRDDPRAAQRMRRAVATTYRHADTPYPTDYDA